MDSQPRNSLVVDVVGRFFPMTLRGEVKFRPKWLLDVGVGSGREAEDLLSLWPELRIVGLEPSADRYAVATSRGYPGTLLNHGAWSHARDHRLSREADSSTLFNSLEASAETYHEDVTVRPLDELLVQGVEDAVLWLDIEGAELEALRGAWQLLQSRVLLLNVEVRQTPRLVGACSEAEIDAFLAGFGFVKATTYNVHVGSDPHRDAVYVSAKTRRSW